METRFLPFVHPSWSPRSVWASARFLLAVPLLLLPRTILLALLALVSYTCLLFGTYLIPWQRSRDRFFSGCVLLLSRCVLFAFGFHSIEWHGLHHRLNGDTLVANHISVMDILVLLAKICPAFVSKHSVTQVPLIGRVASQVLGSVFVHRTAPHQMSPPDIQLEEPPDWDGACTSHPSPLPGLPVRRSATEEIRRFQRQAAAARALGQDYRCLAVFPEGTTTNGLALAFFHSGAFVEPESVVPLAIEYPCGEGQFWPSYESIPTLTFLFYLLTQWQNRVRVTVLPRVHRKPGEKPVQFARRVQLALALHLGIAIVPSASLDSKLSFHNKIRQGAFHWNQFSRQFLENELSKI